MRNGKWQINSGFTLIELLVVISIIGILATLVMANLNSARSRARDAGRKSDIRNVATALRLYYNDKGGYPTPSSALVWGSEFSSGTTIYMSKLPKDPLSPDQDYKYVVGAGADTFTLSACLENASDPNGVTASGISCDSNWMFQIVQ